MSTQAKNRILAYVVIAMMAVAVFLGNASEKAKNTPPSTTTVLIPTQDASEVVIADTGPTYEESEFECMRANLYFEAGNQKRKGMEAVALVTLNRTKLKHYPSTVCDVVKSYAVAKSGRRVCQFSWYCDGKSDIPVLNNRKERKAWERATEVARAALAGEIPDFLGRATHYHADYVSPVWSKAAYRIRPLGKVGTHFFYRDIKLGLKA